MITVKKSEYNKAKLRKLFREASQQYIQITEEEAQELGLIEQGPTGPTGEINPPQGPTGNTEPEDPNHDYSKDYFTIETLNNDISIKFSQPGLNYSYNGITWYELQYNTKLNIPLSGTKILFKGLLQPYKLEGIGSFIGPLKLQNKSINVYGNIMSLLYGDNFINKYDLSDKQYAFTALFKDVNIINANNLILPATILSNECYFNMFVGCESLITVPKLPATTLAYACYYGMFSGCSSLVTAPELLATMLDECCYTSMFKNCYKLNYIKCLALNNFTNSISSNMDEWTVRVSNNGTFIKSKNTQWEIGENGIPEGWEIIEVEE